jgi:hypothetical protein
LAHACDEIHNLCTKLLPARCRSERKKDPSAQIKTQEKECNVGYTYEPDDTEKQSNIRPTNNAKEKGQHGSSNSIAPTWII